MKYSSFLIDNPTTLVIDTSVLINIYASGSGRRILRYLPNDICIPEIVVAELKKEDKQGTREIEFVQSLYEEGLVELTDLEDSECNLFESLVSSSSSLGDGEAATITIGASRHYLPVIDDNKGRLVAKQHLHILECGWSLDLFRHPNVIAGIGDAEATNALYLALHAGRMRIHENHCEHVVSLIGVRKALKCTCLPGFKRRRNQWLVSVQNRRTKL